MDGYVVLDSSAPELIPFRTTKMRALAFKRDVFCQHYSCMYPLDIFGYSKVLLLSGTLNVHSQDSF